VSHLSIQKHDFPGVYWALSQRLLAGPYPCAADLPSAETRVATLLKFGVDYVVDLTEPGEYDLRHYWPLLLAQAGAANRRVERWQSSIPDMGTPTVEQMRHILLQIDTVLHARRTVYVHCFGGIGRTGTVIGCYLVQQGMSGDEALAAIARLRSGLVNGHKSSPETPAQRKMVRSWQR
jgi:hypothetical protein